MFKISNNDFKILNNYKHFLKSLDAILENIPRKDMYYKDKIRDISIILLEDIFKCSYDVSTKGYYEKIKANIALLDFLLDRLYDKKYVSEKAIYKVSLLLVEINKMVTGWINNRRKHESSNS